MSKLGLFPAIVERESGRKTYNLAACAGRLPGSYFLLRRALDAGARPEAIVLEVHPTYLDHPFHTGFHAWPDLLDTSECLELAWSARDASFLLSTCLHRALPSLAGRREIRTTILAALEGVPVLSRSITRPNSLAYWRNLIRNSGALVNSVVPPYHGGISPHLESMYLVPHWNIHPLNEHYLRRVLDLCSSRDIRVYWLIPPMVPELQARREQLGLDDAYTRFAERILRTYPDLIVLDGRRSGYEPSVFQDAAHLDLPGAVAFSAEVGRALRADRDSAPGRNRWVKLPPYRDRPLDPALEDFPRSMQAVIDSGAVRR